MNEELVFGVAVGSGEKTERERGRCRGRRGGGSDARHGAEQLTAAKNRCPLKTSYRIREFGAGCIHATPRAQ